MKRGKVKITGLQNVLNNLNKEIREIEGLSMKGLIRAAIIIRRDMDKTSPLIPIDKGNLRASYYTVTGRNFLSADLPTETTPSFRGKEKGEMAATHSQTVAEARTVAGGQLTVVMGFSAIYAMRMHELVDGNFKRPGAGAKFFESSINRNHDAVLRELRKHVTIKK